jgi:hypothetical protein
MAAPEAMRARQAALLLHGMPVEARDRVLSRLSEPEAARLQPLLRELAELGTSRSPLLARPAADASARERAGSLEGAMIAQAVSPCAPVTVAALLGIADWPWKDELLAHCAELRRAEIKQHLRGGAPVLPPAVAEALCEHLWQAVRGVERDRQQSLQAHQPRAVLHSGGNPRINRRLRRILSWTR